MNAIRSDIAEITDALLKFRDERNWGQFHNSKDLALAISIEASELNELFLWKTPDQVDESRLKGELADVFAFALLLAGKHGFNVKEMVLNKITENGRKYPIQKSRDVSTKYDRL